MGLKGKDSYFVNVEVKSLPNVNVNTALHLLSFLSIWSHTPLPPLKWEQGTI